VTLRFRNGAAFAAAFEDDHHKFNAVANQLGSAIGQVGDAPGEMQVDARDVMQTLPHMSSAFERQSDPR
jgi:hypothetical protein